MAAFAADAALDNLRALMISAPRYCTLGLKYSSTHF